MAVKSAERVLRIFELLEKNSDGMTNKEISSAMHYASSSTLALLQTMTENGYLIVDEQKRYSLGGRLVSLGEVAASRFDIVRISAPYLKHLMQEVEETCFLGVLSGDEIVYIAKEMCNKTINTNAYVGARKPVYCTGLGKAFLAFLPPSESIDIMKKLKYERFTEHTINSFEELRKQISDFRLQGYAVDDQEIEEGLWCMAVPIYDGYHRMIAAISVSGPKPRMIQKFDIIEHEMLKTGKELSKVLGYQKEED